MFTFGVGSYGKLGHGNDYNQLVPKLVEELETERVVSLSCGADHMAALNSTALPTQLPVRVMGLMLTCVGGCRQLRATCLRGGAEVTGDWAMGRSWTARSRCR